MPRMFKIGGRKDRVNWMAVDKVVTIICHDSAPTKRLKDQAREDGRLVDVTHGGPTRSLIITTANQVILSNVSVSTLTQRFQDDRPGPPPEEPGLL